MPNLGGGSFAIRRADPERDVPFLVDLTRYVQDVHAAAEPGSFRPGNDIPGAAAFHAQFMGTDGWFTFVAESGDALIGYITLEHQSQSAGTFRGARNRLYVHQLSVHPAHRRTGVGAALMRRAEECASELRATEVTLDTWAFNAAAQAFFTALGYNVYNYRLRKGLGE